MLNIFNKNENTTESPLWKWAYIGLVILISVAYFIFSYHYVQEGRYIELGLGELEVKNKYTTATISSTILIYVFFIFPIIFNINNSDRYFYDFIIFFTWCMFVISPYFIFYKIGL